MDTARHDSLAASFAASSAGVMAFIAVVTEGSFARAADRLGVGRSAVSRSVQKLEEQLAARLFRRTTRSTTLTREGELFYANCSPGVERIVQALDDMRELRGGPPRGHLRIVASSGFGRRVVAPLLHGFQARFPDISLDLLLDERAADFTADRIDIAFRDGRMEDSQIIARRLITMQRLVCASPDYARAHGLPQSVDELSQHHGIPLRLANGRVQDWEFKVDGQPRRFAPQGTRSFNDADLVLQAVLAGHGIAQLAGYQIADRLRTRQLLACLPQYAPDDSGHYLCYLSRQQMPARMRVFIDYISDQIRALNLQCLGDFDVDMSSIDITQIGEKPATA